MRDRPSRGNASYDYSRRKGGKPDEFHIDSFDFKGRADMKVRNVGRYADNPMYDASRLNEDEASMLDRLHAMLSKAEVSDDEIEKGIRLTAKGMQKVAARLGIAASDVPMLVNSLTSKLRREHRQIEDDYDAMVESHGRYAHETDVLGNVTLRDSETGREVFLRGSEATVIRGRLANGEDEQTVVGEYMASLREAAEPDSYDAEMHSTSGSYNFPWRARGRHGTATARYDGQGPSMHLEVVHVRDHRGDEFEADPALARDIEKAARDFIGRE